MRCSGGLLTSMQSRSYDSPAGMSFLAGQVLWTVLNTSSFTITMFVLSILPGLTDSLRRAERREEVDAAESLEQSCDVQQMFSMRNYIHAQTLARLVKLPRVWDRTPGHGVLNYGSAGFSRGPGGLLVVRPSRSRRFFKASGVSQRRILLKIDSESSFAVCKL